MADLQREIAAKLQQKKNAAQIKNELTPQGFSPDQIDAAISVVQKKQQAKKTTFVVISVLILIVVVALAVFIWQNKLSSAQTPVTEPAPYSNNPNDWLSKTSKGITIHPERVTWSRTSADGNNLILHYQGGIRRFVLSGWYKNKTFTDIFIGDEGTIKITREMNPNDGVMNAYIVEDINDGKATAYLFVDEDWKAKWGNATNIFWGASYEYVKPYEFHAVGNGIYMDTISDDMSRFSPDLREVQGGVAVGKASKAEKDTGNLASAIVVLLN